MRERLLAEWSRVQFLINPGFTGSALSCPWGGCRVGFSLKLVAWWARGSVRAGWAAAGYLSANGCRVQSTRRFLCWRLKKTK
ncbi:hypothetical protein Hanom_Chr04g00369001 [Helianthus anomalus]